MNFKSAENQKCIIHLIFLEIKSMIERPLETLVYLYAMTIHSFDPKKEIT